MSIHWGKGYFNGLQTLEKELIIAAQQGSVGAFEQLIGLVEKKMLSLAAGLASSPDEADDIYQDAMVSAFKALPKFRLESQFSTWIYRIVVNTAISSKRKLKSKINRYMTPNRHDGGDYLEQASYEQYGHLDNPEAELVNEQLNQAINRALACLSDKERVAFVLCHQQEFKIVDAAQVMNCSDGTVKSYLFRAREKMRAELTPYVR